VLVGALCDVEAAFTEGELDDDNDDTVVVTIAFPVVVEAEAWLSIAEVLLMLLVVAELVVLVGTLDDDDDTVFRTAVIEGEFGDDDTGVVTVVLTVGDDKLELLDGEPAEELEDDESEDDKFVCTVECEKSTLIGWEIADGDIPGNGCEFVSGVVGVGSWFEELVESSGFDESGSGGTGLVDAFGFAEKILAKIALMSVNSMPRKIINIPLPANIIGSTGKIAVDKPTKVITLVRKAKTAVSDMISAT
jgi:hypothetical protein